MLTEFAGHRSHVLTIVSLSVVVALLIAIAVVGRSGQLVVGLCFAAILATVFAIAQSLQVSGRHEELIDVAVSLDQQSQSGREEIASLESRLRDLTSLYRAISAVNSVSDHERVPKALLAAGLELVGGDCGSLMMIDELQGRLLFTTAVGLSEEILSGTSQLVGQGIAGHVAKTGEPLLLVGTIGDDDHRFVNPRPHKRALSTSMCIPLQLGERIIGVINLGASVESGIEPFGDEEMRLGFIFAQHASVAIERAILLKGTDDPQILFTP